jgi:hypothetical protein
MLHFTIETAVPRPLLMAARQAARGRTYTGAHNYYFYGYIGNLLYCLELGMGV